MTKINITVLIAAYNAEAFILDAIESAVVDDTVTEVVVVDDGSKDNTRSICEAAASRINKVKFFCHPDHGNHGAGATWNFAASQATNLWLAILGADDIFLNNRFESERIRLSEPDVDAVHGFMTSHFVDSATKEHYNTKGFSGMWNTGLDQNCPSNEVKHALLGISRSYRGYFSLNALTFRKSLFDKVGGFNTLLRLHQDTDIILKLAIAGNVVPGKLADPICSRGVHEDNRILNNADVGASRELFWNELDRWLNENRLEYSIKPNVIEVARTNKLLYSFAKLSPFKSLTAIASAIMCRLPSSLSPAYHRPIFDILDIHLRGNLLCRCAKFGWRFLSKLARIAKIV